MKKFSFFLVAIIVLLSVGCTSSAPPMSIDRLVIDMFIEVCQK